MHTILVNASYGKHLNLDATCKALETDRLIKVINSAQQHTNQRPVSLQETLESLHFVMVAVVTDDTNIREFTACFIKDYLFGWSIDLSDYHKPDNLAELFYMIEEPVYLSRNESDCEKENTGNMLYCGLEGLNRHIFAGAPDKYFHDLFKLDCKAI